MVTKRVETTKITTQHFTQGLSYVNLRSQLETLTLVPSYPYHLVAEMNGYCWSFRIILKT